MISLPYHTDNSSKLQNLDIKVPINAILTDGNDYKTGFVFASKTISDKIISRNKRRNNISLAVYFKPDEASKNAVINILDLDKDKQELMERFSSGDCFIKGSVYNFRTGANDKAVIYGKVIRNEE